ncbi:MAG: PAS domain S-box protein, partial [Gemmatimonadota bacterium]
MSDNQIGDTVKQGWKAPARARLGPNGPANVTASGAATPDEDLSEAVQRVRRHELERRVERLTGEADRLKRDLAALERFRLFIDQAGEAIYLIEADTGKFIDVNDTGVRWLGLPRSHLLTMTVDDINVEFPLQYPDSSADHVTNTRSVDRPWVFGGGVHRRRDGSTFPVEVAVSSRRLAERDYILVVARETHSRTRTERRLQEVEEKYRTLFDFTSDAFYL